MTDLSVILRAEQYDDGDFYQAPRPTRRNTMSQSPTENHHEYYANSHQSYNNKRSPEPVEDEEHAGGGTKKRARGRPRVEPKDDTAADRRRTQIRLAQRAYRNRKETAIQTLEKKVNVLQDSNEEMSKAFMSLYDSAVAQGLLTAAPEFGRQLQATTEKFVALARQTSEDGSARDAEQANGGHESDGANGGSTGSGGNSGAGQRAARSSGSPESTGWHASSSTASRSSGQGGATSATSTSSGASPGQDFASTAPLSVRSYHDVPRPVRRESIVPIRPASPPFGYRFAKTSAAHQHHSPRAAVEIITRATVDNASFPVGTSPLGAPPPLENEPPTTPYALATAASSPSPPPPATVPYFFPTHSSLSDPVPAVPSSYSYLESTFGRRLQRAALEQGLVLLHMPSPPPHVYAAVFGFCLLFESKNKIIKRVTECIGRGTGRTLHNWRHPFFHLGGAGSFFDHLVSHEEDGRGGSNNNSNNSNGNTSNTNSYGDGRFPSGDSDNDRPLGNQGTRGPHKPMRGANFSTGPFTAEVEHARDYRVDQRMRINVPGFEGDFFDPDEIEFFLRRKGVYIPPASDFVTVEVDVGEFLVDNPGGSAAADLLGGPATGGDTLGASGAVDFDAVMLGATATITGALDAPLPTTTAAGAIDPLLDPGIADPFADITPASMPSLTDTIDFNFSALSDADFFLDETSSPPSTRRSVTLNIEVFVHELVWKSVCLGRAPGVRPKDVISAFWAATTDA